jgi:hypothetical protein
MTTDIASYLATRDQTPAPAIAHGNVPRNTILRGDCLQVLPQLAARSADFVLTDPPYLVDYRSRDGRSVPNDDNDTWLKPAFAELYRVLVPNTFAVSFYGWPCADKFLAAWRAAGFRIVGHFVFPKRYTSATRLLRYQHECAYLLAKGFPKEPGNVIGDVIDWTYSGNKPAWRRRMPSRRTCYATASGTAARCIASCSPSRTAGVSGTAVPSLWSTRPP